MSTSNSSSVSVSPPGLAPELTRTDPADPVPRSAVRHKLVAALAGLFLGPLGVHRLYLRQPFWWLLPLLTLPLIGHALRQSVWFREWSFHAFGAIVVIAWLQTIIICLMPLDRFNLRFNGSSVRKSSGGALPVLVAVVSLMLSTTLLMSILALALEGIFMARGS